MEDLFRAVEVVLWYTLLFPNVVRPTHQSSLHPFRGARSEDNRWPWGYEVVCKLSTGGARTHKP